MKRKPIHITKPLSGKAILETLNISEETREEVKKTIGKEEMEEYTTGTGQTLKVHDKEDCKGRHCCIHNPSDHHMKDWPTNWRSDRGLMERICPEHGVGHPDPDDLAFKELMGINASVEAVHGCCGCCNPNTQLLTKEDVNIE